jgi:predicted nucleic acid-binding protein
MPLVVDASAILPLFLKEEQRDFAELTLASMVNDRAVAPILFWFEVRNALLVAERRGRLDGSTQFILDDLATLPIELRQPPIGYEIFELGRKHYDAALDLAVRHGMKLAILDGKLAEAAYSENVDLLCVTTSIDIF